MHFDFNNQFIKTKRPRPICQKFQKKIILFSFNINVLSTVTHNQYIGSFGLEYHPNRRGSVESSHRVQPQVGSLLGRFWPNFIFGRFRPSFLLGRDWPVKKKFKKITLKFVIFLRKFLTTF
jgi:hypothetical protein